MGPCTAKVHVVFKSYDPDIHMARKTCTATYIVSQISYGRSIDNMEQTVNCFTEVVFNFAVWYLSSRKMMSRYPLPDLPKAKHIWFLTRSRRSRFSCDNHRGSRLSRGWHEEWTCASTRWSSHADLRNKMYPTYSKMATNFVFLCLHDNNNNNNSLFNCQII